MGLLHSDPTKTTPHQLKFWLRGYMISFLSALPLPSAMHCLDTVICIIYHIWSYHISSDSCIQVVIWQTWFCSEASKKNIWVKKNEWKCKRECQASPQLSTSPILYGNTSSWNSFFVEMACPCVIPYLSIILGQNCSGFSANTYLLLFLLFLEDYKAVRCLQSILG